MVEKLCEEFNVIINQRKKLEEKEVEKDKYPWLDDSNERKYMTDGEILEKYVNLDNSCCIWQGYINTKLNCLESRKYCEAIMDAVHTI